MTKAYSYIRFSTEKQELGDSLRRQTALADAYALDHNLELVNDYRDLGVSAYKGLNSELGALSEFIKAVDERKIKPGSYLLVESLDRLSRQSVDLALEQFMGTTRRGIIIVTLQDKQVYSKESIRENWTKLIMALAVMARANEESATKSKRVAEAWKNKRAQGGILTKMCPAWLKVVDGKFEVIEAKANIVRKIFQYAYDGDGSPTIARKLHEEKIPTMVYAPMWTFAHVAALLKNKAVMGTLDSKKAKNTEETPDYYPAIVAPEIFAEVQARVAARKWKGGRNTDNVRNLLSGLCYCKCGAKLRAVAQGPDFVYLRCLNAYSGAGCKAPKVPYHAVEQLFIQRWSTQGRLQRLLENREKRDAAFEIDPLVEAENNLDGVNEKIKNLLDAIEAGGNIKSLVQRLTDAEEQKEILLTQIEELKKPKRLMSDVITDAGHDFFMKHEEVMASGDPEVIRDWRLRTQSAIRRFIMKAVFDASTVGTVELTYLSGTVREMDYREYIKPKGFQKGNNKGKKV